MSWLDFMIGADTPVDLGLRGGETIRLDDRVRWHVLHAAGHSAGHLALWEPRARVLIAQDAVLWCGVPDRAGQLPSPPPYDDVDSYLATLRRLRELNPEWLLTAHYPIIRAAEVDAFFAESLVFVERVDALILDALRAAGQPLMLSDLVAALDAQLGQFAVAIQWVGPTLAHLRFELDVQGTTGMLRLGNDTAEISYAKPVAFEAARAETPDFEWQVLETGTLPDLPAPPAFALAARELIDALEGRATISSTGADGRASMEMIMALYESQRRGNAPVQLPLPVGSSPLTALAREQGWG
ncbi:MAG: MBL fold metallo-hydrolase [Roseiflexaceae bacterium]